MEQLRKLQEAHDSDSSLQLEQDQPSVSHRSNRKDFKSAHFSQRSESRRGTTKEITTDMRKIDTHMEIERMRKGSDTYRKRFNKRTATVALIQQTEESLKRPRRCNYKKNIVYNYGVKSRKGERADGSEKNNQDNYLIKQGLMNDKNLSLFAVMDGHGEEGHHVSRFIKNNLTHLLETQLKEMGLQDSHQVDDIIEQALLNTFDRLAEELQASSVECKESGSTIVLLLVYGDVAWVANLGDSRAIVLRNDNNQPTVSYSTYDQKPENPDERDRIELAGGRVFASKGTEFPLRVWLRKEDKPGLAMTRSMGDFMCKRIGVSQRPVIQKIYLESSDQAVLLASDGVWEFIENEQALQIAFPFLKQNNPDGLCGALVKSSLEAWQSEQGSIDDITVLAVFVLQ